MENKNDEREHHRKHVVIQNCIAYYDKRLIDIIERKIIWLSENL